MPAEPTDPPSVMVAPTLMPARTFDLACALVVDYLMDAIPLGLWAVTGIWQNEQIMLEVRSPGYEGVVPGGVAPVGTSFCLPMSQGLAPRIAPDVSRFEEYAAAAKTMPMPVAAYLGTPIVRPDGSLFGTVCGFARTPQPESLTKHQPLLDVFSSLLSAVLDADSTAVAAARELERSRQEAETDSLTGLINRRGWDRFLAEEEKRFQRFADPACVVVLDLDLLKEVNDTFGHDAGDRYIQRAAAAMSSVVRHGDVLARLGGDEFGIVMIGAQQSHAVALIARMEQALQDAGVSGSFGHAPYSVIAGFPGAWKAADEAMYASKKLRRKAFSRN